VTLALARIARVPWWRRVLAWWRTRRAEREWLAAEKRRILDEHYESERRFRAFVERSIAAGALVIDQRGRRLTPPPPMPIPGDGTPRR
jgi:hypothetical protein